MLLRLDSRLEDVKGVGEKYSRVLKRQGILTVFDLLLHFPVYYIDFKRTENSPGEEKKLYCVQVERQNLTRNFRKRLSILKVKARLGENQLHMVFFNRPYLFDFFKSHKSIYFYGKVEEREGTLQVVNPLVFTDAVDRPVIPVYASISTLKSGKLRNIIENIFDCLEDDFEPLPGKILERYGFPGIPAALAGIHFPDSYDQRSIHRLKRRFIYREFLFFQLELQTLRNYFRRVARVHPYRIDDRIRETVKKKLRFDLTSDQEKVIEEIEADLRGDFAMQRLLQGDVGSGKTVIAFLSLLMARKNGYQGAFLVPTEILARQHFEGAGEFFEEGEAALITGSTPAKKKGETRRRLETGEVKIVFGTHALLEENIAFKDLSMIVIDEQHRFGVSQRAALYTKGRAVDLLVMTATPIPRTLLLSIYNDLSVSVIKEKPAGRKPIKTRIVDVSRREAFYGWLKTRIAKGEKAYIVLPLIEKSDFFSQLRSIEAESRYFREIFDPHAVGIVTGKSVGDEKEQVLRDFDAGRIRVLISTTVIEVGIDVRDATVMVIENADRYGLAQLHQLRGRVGRGEAQSLCYLLPSPQVTEKGKQRLKTIAASEDGFKIAEMDLKMRGGGIIPGFRQTGYLDFRLGDAAGDRALFKKAREDAGEILNDPALQNREFSDYLSAVHEKIKKINFS